MSTFTWVPDFGASSNEKPTVSSSKFGDGYEQRAQFGINNLAPAWSLKFSIRDTAETAAILSFLRATNGVQSFDWTPPGETSSIKVVARSWTKSTDRYDQFTVSATFEQVFDP